jgi:ferredoxin
MTEYRVTLSNRDGAAYMVNGRRPLLEQLRDQDVDLPYGCEYGGCITCAAKLVEGHVDQRRQVALNNRQIENGYVILCVAARGDGYHTRDWRGKSRQVIS